MRRYAIPFLALLLASCAALPPPPAPAPPAEESPAQAKERRSKAPPPAYNLAGYPPPARDGYIDGCESAKKSQFGRKDEKRFAADAQYRMGWSDGYSICSRR
jgi:hypothetical protein